MTVQPGHLRVGDERVEDRLLGGLDDRREVRVQGAPGDEAQRAQPVAGLAVERLRVRRERARVAGREREEEVAGEVGAGGAGAADAGRHAAGERAALVRQQRRVGGHDRHDRAGARRGEEVRHRVVVRERRADRHAGDRQLLAIAEVGLDEDADGVLPDAPRGGPGAALEVVAVHPGPAADRALLDGPAARGVERGDHDGLGHVPAVDVVEVAVPGLARDRQEPGVGELGMRAHGPADDPRVRDPDRVRVRQADRARRAAGLADPGEPGHLAVAVLHVHARDPRITRARAPARVDRRHAGAHRLALDQRRVAQLEPGDVGDRVGGPGLAGERDAERARPREPGRGRRVGAAHGGGLCR